MIHFNFFLYGVRQSNFILLYEYIQLSRKHQHEWRLGITHIHTLLESISASLSLMESIGSLDFADICPWSLSSSTFQKAAVSQLAHQNWVRGPVTSTLGEYMVSTSLVLRIEKTVFFSNQRPYVHLVARLMYGQVTHPGPSSHLRTQGCSFQDLGFTPWLSMCVSE